MWFQNQRPILWGFLKIYHHYRHQMCTNIWILTEDREIAEYKFSRSGTLYGPLLENHQTSLGSLFSDAQKGLICLVGYHAHGSPPGSHSKQRSRLPEFGLWFSHGLAAFISWAGGRMKWDGGGSYEGAKGCWSPKPLLHAGRHLRKAPLSDGWR